MMKTILAPTDFSDISRNAVYYAAEIAFRTKAKLIVFHAYHPAVVVSEVPVVIVPTDEEIERDCRKKLKRILQQLITKHGRTLEVQLVCINGLGADAVTEYANEHKADLIVMGTHGAGYLEEKLLGSVTSEVVKRTEVPVLSIAPKAKFCSMRKIAFATDYVALKNIDKLTIISELARLFRSHIYIVHVASEKQPVPTVTQAVEGLKLDRLLEGLDHSFHVVLANDVKEGMHLFTSERQIDLVVMLPRSRSFLKSVFHTSATKDMLFHTTIPLLTIHE